MTKDAGRIALVTGASRGIGRAIAIELASRGYRVALNYQSAEASAEETLAVIRAAGGSAMAVRADVSDSTGVSELFETVIKEFGPVEVLVNNAGITRDNLLMRMKDEEWLAVLKTNLDSVYYCTKAALRSMIKGRFGRIVAISSVSSLVGNAGQTNYAAAKAGILGFIKSVAREVASRGVTANIVAPGYVNTDMTSVLSKEIREGILSRIPVGRYGDPKDIARAVAFLVSDDTSYITGQILAVDGGMTM